MIRPSLCLALLLVAPAMAQERPAGLVGTGVVASTRANSAERPLRFAASPPAGAALVIPVTGTLDIARAAPGLPAAEAVAIQRAAEALRFEPGALNTRMLAGVAGRPAVLLVGMKPAGSAPSPTELADAGGKALQALRDLPHPIAIVADGLPAGSAQHLALGAALGQYRFDRLKSAAKAPPADPVTVVAADGSAAEAAWRADGRHLADAVRFTRDLVTTPANALWPEAFVEAVQAELRGLPNVRVTVLDEAAMRRLNMGAFLSVAHGSRRPGRLMAVEYRGAAAGQPPLALVGKGITFDSGGISIKPNAGMWEMKGDMAGAAAVMGTVIAAARRGAPVNLVAVAALAENMPSGDAARPGDVVRTMDGLTAEIWSTDAEGRMVMADANQWVIRTHRPAALVNIATLTGSIVQALGPDHAGLFGRDEALAAQLLAAGEAGGEPLWRMPLVPAYAERMKSEIADIRDVSGGAPPGAGLAAHFLSFMTPAPTPWAHVDMAGVDRAEAALPTVPVGPRGFGVRLLDALVRAWPAR